MSGHLDQCDVITCVMWCDEGVNWRPGTAAGKLKKQSWFSAGMLMQWTVCSICSSSSHQMSAEFTAFYTSVPHNRLWAGPAGTSESTSETDIKVYLFNRLVLINQTDWKVIPEKLISSLWNKQTEVTLNWNQFALLHLQTSSTTASQDPPNLHFGNHSTE